MGQTITVTVNGTAHTAEVEPRMLLVHFIREELRLRGTHPDSQNQPQKSGKTLKLIGF